MYVSHADFGNQKVHHQYQHFAACQMNLCFSELVRAFQVASPLFVKDSKLIRVPNANSCHHSINSRRPIPWTCCQKLWGLVSRGDIPMQIPVPLQWKEGIVGFNLLEMQVGTTRITLLGGRDVVILLVMFLME